MKNHLRHILYHQLLLLLLLLTAPAYSYSHDSTSKSLLWEISGNGLTKPSYLYGTIHAICPEDFRLSETLKDKMNKTEQLTLEVNMDDPAFAMQLMKGATLPDGKSLRSFFSEEDYKKVQEHFIAIMKVDIEHMDTMKPFILNSMLMVQFAECKTLSYETALMQLAKEQGKRILGLETVQDQLDVFDKIPYKTQATMMLHSLEHMDESKAKFRKMIDLYVAQDLTELQRLIKQDFSGEYATFGTALITDRNHSWIPAIEQTARAKPTFFAVGAGHLGGDNGVLELLRKRGYIITPVKQ